MKFSFHNATGAAVYVDWSARKARLRILRDDVDVLVDPGCSPLCKVACGCLACPAPERKVLKIGPNDKLEVTWEAVHFLLHTCEPPASCACAEPWPVTAGKYRVQLDGSTKVLGGVADPTDPRVLADAELDALAPKCTAGATFELVGASQVTIPIECQ